LETIKYNQSTKLSKDNQNLWVNYLFNKGF